VTIALAITSGALAVIAGVLVLLLLRLRVKETAATASPPTRTAEPVTPAVEALARDLQEALADYRPQAPAPAPAPAALRGVSRPPAATSRRTRAQAPASRRERERGRASTAPRPQPDSGTTAPVSLASNQELGELLTQALSTARAIPGVDAAAVALPAWREPVIGTLGLARHEANRLASTLPSAGARTRSIAIEYEYEDGAGPAPEGRLQRGVAVPVPGLPTPGLIAILTRSPGTVLGTPQVELLEEVVERLAPALASVLEWDAAALPVAITVRDGTEAGDPRRRPGHVSPEREKRQELGQVDRFHER
jgi:hypothetical protein